MSAHTVLENQSRAAPQGKEPGKGLTGQLQWGCAKLWCRDGGDWRTVV